MHCSRTAELSHLPQEAEVPELCKLFPSNSVSSSQVPLLLHQRQALAWLLWRESQRPCGGILGEQQNGKVPFRGEEREQKKLGM